jgi:hypothetical protein
MNEDKGRPTLYTKRAELKIYMESATKTVMQARAKKLHVSVSQFVQGLYLEKYPEDNVSDS